MNKLFYILPLTAIISCGTEEVEETTEAQESVVETIEKEIETNNDRKSPRTKLEIEADDLTFSVDYGSPRVKGRTIWGDLVAYDAVWRAGADETTAITFEHDVLFGDSPVSAGTYALFIVPHLEGNWEIILNEEWSKEEHDVWGAYDYDESKDVVRIEAKPQTVADNEENLTYDFKAGEFIFRWEKIQLSVSLTAAPAV